MIKGIPGHITTHVSNRFSIAIDGSSHERYPMCDDQHAQIDCRLSSCIFNAGAGTCVNVSPAITLNTNGTLVCWSRKEKGDTDD